MRGGIAEGLNLSHLKVLLAGRQALVQPLVQPLPRALLVGLYINLANISPMQAANMYRNDT